MPDNKYSSAPFFDPESTEDAEPTPKSMTPPNSSVEGAQDPVGLSLLSGDRAVLTIEEAAELLNISRSSAYAAAKNGELPARKIGRRVVVPVPLIRTWLGYDSEDLRPIEDGPLKPAPHSQWTGNPTGD